MYNAFISYSHATDDKFAPSLQDALQKFAKPWYKKRNLEIFRDQSSLSATPHLWNNITKALDQSEYFILLASPESENSKWVNKEIEYWLEHKSIDTFLIALTDGTMEWDDENNCFLNPDNNSLPPALDNKFDSEPFYIDLRLSRTEEDLTLDNPIFKKEVLKLAAKLHGKQPNDLASVEVTVHRKMVRLRNVVIVSLILLSVYSYVKSKEAETEMHRAQSFTLSAYAREQLEKNPTIAIRLAELAWQQSPNQPPFFAIQNVLSEVVNQSGGVDSGKFNPFAGDIKLFYDQNFYHPDTVISAVFSRDGEKILTLCDLGIARLWDATTGELLKDSLNGNRFGVLSAVFSPDGKKILTSCTDDTVRIWDVQSYKLDDITICDTSFIYSAIFSSDGKKILTAGIDGIAKIWDAETGKLISSFLAPERKNNMLFSKVALQNSGNTWRSASAIGGRVLNSVMRILHHKKNNDTRVVFSPDGRKILTASDKANPKIWVVQSEKVIRLIGATGIANIAAFSPDGKKIVIASTDKSVKIWDAESGKLIDSLDAGKGVVTSASFSPDGREIVIASTDKTAKVWDVLSGKLIAILLAHKGIVTSASFSLDGKKILTASDDNTAKIWNAESGTLIGILLARKGYDTSTIILDNGKKLVPVLKLDSEIWPTPKDIMAWLSSSNIYRLTQKDLKNLGIDFIELK